MFCEFDRVITINFAKLQKGSVIVFWEGDKYLIKRVKDIKKDEIIAESDNKELASKVYKIKFDDVIGRVLLKY